MTDISSQPVSAGSLSRSRYRCQVLGTCTNPVHGQNSSWRSRTWLRSLLQSLKLEVYEQNDKHVWYLPILFPWTTSGMCWKRPQRPPEERKSRFFYFCYSSFPEILWLLHKKYLGYLTLTFTGLDLRAPPQSDEWQQDGPIRREDSEAYLSWWEPSAFSQSTCRRQRGHCRAVTALTLRAEPRPQLLMFYLFIIILLSSIFPSLTRELKHAAACVCGVVPQQHKMLWNRWEMVLSYFCFISFCRLIFCYKIC